MKKIREFFQEYSDELLFKVQWPAIADLQASTVTVLIASVLIASVIFVMDFGFSNIMKFLYELFAS